jgi:arylsulfatase A-like enzyme
MQARISTCYALGLLSILPACGGGAKKPGPAWVELARGFEPRPLLDTVRGWEDPRPAATGLPTVRVRPDEADEGVWVEQVLEPAAWTADELPGLWWIPLPRQGPFRFAQGPLRLRAGERVFTRALETDDPSPNSFVVSDERVLLFLGEGVAPPAETLFGIQVRDGLAVDGKWRVRIGDHVGAGIPVWVGQEEELTLDLFADAQLHFMTYYSPTLAQLAAEEPRAAFEIQLDDVTIWADEHGPGLASHTIPLPAAGRENARLTLRVAGAPGLGVFYDPVKGPAEHGTYGARPWGKGRPNIVLFLADTFRADNLFFHGGRPELAPNLNRFAERSLRFARARSTAAWTLPALGTLFTGALPGRHGATDIGTALPRDLDTITELLERRGYRTAAITDSGFFTIAFGMDQGFSWFEENQNVDWDLEHTIDEAVRFLEQDDGRPVFLVVHSYRTHAPYRQGPEADATAWDQLMEEAFRMLDERRAAGARGDVKREVLLTFKDRLEALYRAGVVDLDRGFGRFVEELEARHVLDDGFLIFTSDHGEALGENGDIMHGGRLWDVKLHIPLLIYGPRLAPQDVEWAATLADLPATFAWMAGVPAPTESTGASLVTLSSERPQLAFRLEENNRELAVYDREKKLMTLPDVERLRQGDVDAAYDLAVDPRESTNLCQESWASELAQRMAASVAESLVPITEPAAVHAAPEALRDLQKIGYNGNE